MLEKCGQMCGQGNKKDAKNIVLASSRMELATGIEPVCFDE
jgi:hypothetical protein